MKESKKPGLDHPVHELVAARWSPYSWSNRSVEREDLLSIFEAARWAASAFNEQPWRYIVATKEDPLEFERLLSCLVEANRSWARNAPVLALGVVGLHYTRNGKENLTAHHDLGLASAHLTLEATARGLSVHQMAGIVPERAKELYGIPEGFAAFTGLALGYAGTTAGEFAERDNAPRNRRPLEEFLFSGTFGRAFPGAT